jgi:hypothetical protein
MLGAFTGTVRIILPFSIFLHTLDERFMIRRIEQMSPGRDPERSKISIIEALIF